MDLVDGTQGLHHFHDAPDPDFSLVKNAVALVLLCHKMISLAISALTAGAPRQIV
jgi:hypothetical protein